MGLDQINNLMEVFTAEDPMAFAHPDGDPWTDFREIMRIEWKMDFTYKHILGKYSKFFIELANKKFVTTECTELRQGLGHSRARCAADCMSICQVEGTAGHRHPGELLGLAVRALLHEGGDPLRAGHRQDGRGRHPLHPPVAATTAATPTRSRRA